MSGGCIEQLGSGGSGPETWDGPPAGISTSLCRRRRRQRAKGGGGTEQILRSGGGGPKPRARAGQVWKEPVLAGVLALWWKDLMVASVEGLNVGS